MGGCQDYGPFLGTLNIRCRIMMGTQKGTIILTTTRIGFRASCREAMYQWRPYTSRGVGGGWGGWGIAFEGIR